MVRPPFKHIVLRDRLEDAKNRDVSKVRLREYNALPDYETIEDSATRNEIVKNWYNAFNRLEERDLTWTDILKPLIVRLFNPSRSN